MVIKVSKKTVGGGYRSSVTPLQPFSGKGLSVSILLKKTHNIGYSLISLNILLILLLISITLTVTTLEVIL